jgi:hypothetical protein
MTPSLFKRALQSMDRVFAHPIAKIFLSIGLSSRVQSSGLLPQIYENLLCQSYESLEEWRRDFRLLRQSGDAGWAAISANEMLRLFEKEYKKLRINSVSEWTKAIHNVHHELNEVFESIPRQISALHCLGLSLSSCVPADAAAGDSLRQKPMQCFEYEKYPFLCPPFEPEWRYEDDEDAPPPGEDDEDAFIHFRDFCLFSHPLAAEKQDDASESTEDSSPETPVDQSPAALEPVLTKKPIRIQLKVSGRLPRPHPSDEESSDIEISSKKARRARGSAVIRRRARPKFEWSEDDDGPPSDREIFTFMRAVESLNGKDDVCEMATIVLDHEPDVSTEDPVMNVALERFKPETVRELIRFAKGRFQRQGRQYPG